MRWRLGLLAVALVLGGLAPLATPLDALLNDPGAARAFDYPSLRDGADASGAAWLLIQHADRDPAFQRQILPQSKTQMYSRVRWRRSPD